MKYRYILEIICEHFHKAQILKRLHRCPQTFEKVPEEINNVGNILCKRTANFHALYAIATNYLSKHVDSEEISFLFQYRNYYLNYGKYHIDRQGMLILDLETNLFDNQEMEHPVQTRHVQSANVNSHLHYSTDKEKESKPV